MEYKYLFGPVKSRRLGISLGVDLVPFKTCSLDCVYCECGATTNLTSMRNEYVPTNDVITELDHYLSSTPKLDIVTFSGSGEPTLHNGIGEIIKFIKTKFQQYKVAVLTNSTLLHDKKVRDDILLADVVIPSLDAVSDAVFTKILRPADGLSPQIIIDSLVEFKKSFNGKLIIEIFIISGINDDFAELQKLKDAVVKIGADTVQLNRLDRPGTEKWVQIIRDEKFEEIKKFFEPYTVELVKDVSNKSADVKEIERLDKHILSTVERRPSTFLDLIDTLGVDEKDLKIVLDKLVADNTIYIESLKRGDFYKIVFHK